VSEPLVLASARAPRPGPLSASVSSGHLPTSAAAAAAAGAAGTPVLTMTDVRAFHWTYNTAAGGPYAHVAPVLFDGVLQLTLSSHALEQPQLDRFLEDMLAILSEIA
jgi:hypothetical protein